jgi:hypothetical protein
MPGAEMDLGNPVELYDRLGEKARDTFEGPGGAEPGTLAGSMEWKLLGSLRSIMDALERTLDPWT